MTVLSKNCTLTPFPDPVPEGAYGGQLLPAFPGAEGFGRWSVGGRFGAVLAVTKNTDDGTAGTLRWALNQNIPRTVIFRLPQGTSGTVELANTLVNDSLSYLTLAGQSGNPGMCLKKYGLKLHNTRHAVIRYFRSRPSDENGQDAMNITGGASDHVIIDHCSTTWGTDETLSVDQAKRITLQWNLIADSKGTDGGAGHNYGTLLRGNNDGSSLYSLHHNFWARHKGRMPKIGGNAYVPNTDKSNPGGLFDIRNNVIWQWESYAANNEDYYKWAGGDGTHVTYFDAPVRFNFVNNFYWDDSDELIVMKEAGPFSRGHYSGNSKGSWVVPNQSDIVDYQCLKPLQPGQGAGGADLKRGCWLPSSSAADTTVVAFNTNLPSRPQRDIAHGSISARDKAAYMSQLAFPVDDPVETGPAGTLLFNKVKSGAGNNHGVGASLYRDPVDQAIIIGNTDTTAIVHPALTAGALPLDTDGDGIPDAWESAHGLNPKDAKDANLDLNGNGYSALEEWLHSLAD